MSIMTPGTATVYKYIWVTIAGETHRKTALDTRQYCRNHQQYQDLIDSRKHELGVTYAGAFWREP